MSQLSQSEIQRRLIRIEQLLLSAGITEGALAVALTGSGAPANSLASEAGTIYIDTANDNFYVFDGNEFSLVTEEGFVAYASDVNNASDSGAVTSSSDVTGFTFNSAVNGVALPWIGRFKGTVAPTDVTQYVWSNAKGETGDTGAQGVAATKVFRLDALTPTIPAATASTPPTGWVVIPPVIGIGVQSGAKITFTTSPLANIDFSSASDFPAGFLEPSVSTRTIIKFNNNSGRTGATLETPDTATWDLFVSNNGLTLAQKIAEFAALLNAIATTGVTVEVDGESLIIYSKDLAISSSAVVTIAGAPDNDFGISAVVESKGTATKLWSIAGNRLTPTSNYVWSELLLESGVKGADGAQGATGGAILDFATLTAYSAGDLVQSGNTQWRAIAIIPNTNTTAPVEGTGSWSEVVTESQVVDDLNLAGAILKVSINGTPKGTGVTLYTDLDAQAALDVSNTNTTLTFTDKIGDVKTWTPIQQGTGEANVQSNWSESDTNDDSFIQNKPTTITVAQAGNITTNNSKTGFTNSRARDALAISAVGNTLTFTDNTDTVKTWSPLGTGQGDDNVQSNWTETDDEEDSYIKNKPTLHNRFTTGEARLAVSLSNTASTLTYKDSSGDTQTFTPIQPGSGEANVQSDWTQTVTSEDDYIKNRPTNFANWAQVDSSEEDFIKNKPTIINYSDSSARSALAISDNGSTLTYKNASGVVQTYTPVSPGTGEANVQSNWTEADTNDDSYIQNKPSIPTRYTNSEARGAVNVSHAGAILTYRDSSNVLQTYEPVPPGTGEANVQVNWTETDSAEDAFILNKPTTITSTQAGNITTNNAKTGFTSSLAQTALAVQHTGGTLTYNDASGVSQAFTPLLASQANWLEDDTLDAGFIQNKPTTITSAQTSKLSGIASAAEVNVQADWNISNNASDAFIQNKPVLPPTIPSGLTTDTSKEYNLKITDVLGSETASWVEDTGSGSGITAAEARDALAISDSGNVLTYTDNADAVQTFTPTGTYTDAKARDALAISDSGNVLTYKDASDATQTFTPTGTGATAAQITAIGLNTAKVGFTAAGARDALAISDSGNVLTYTDNADQVQTFTPVGTGATVAQITAIGLNTNKLTYPSSASTKLATIATNADVTADFTGQTAAGNYTVPVRDGGETITKFLREDGDWVAPTGSGSGITAAEARDALAISDNGTTLTYTDASDAVQTFTPSGGQGSPDAIPNEFETLRVNSSLTVTFTSDGTVSDDFISIYNVGGVGSFSVATNFVTLLKFANGVSVSATIATDFGIGEDQYTITNSDASASLSDKITSWVSTINSTSDIDVTATKIGSTGIELLANGINPIFDEVVDGAGGLSIGTAQGYAASLTESFGSVTTVAAQVFALKEIVRYTNNLWVYLGTTALTTTISTPVPVEGVVWTQVQTGEVYSDAAARDALAISDSGNVLTYKDASDITQTFTPTGTGATASQVTAIGLNTAKTGFTAAGARDALAISDNGSTLTYTDASNVVQTFTPSGGGGTTSAAPVSFQFTTIPATLSIEFTANPTTGASSITEIVSNSESLSTTTSGITGIVLVAGQTSGVTIVSSILFIRNVLGGGTIAGTVDKFVDIINTASNLSITATRSGDNLVLASSTVTLLDPIISAGSYGLSASLSPSTTTSAAGQIFTAGEIVRHDSENWELLGDSSLTTTTSTESPVEGATWSRVITASDDVILFKNEDFTAVAGAKYYVSGARTVTLPTSPDAGDTVLVSSINDYDNTISVKAVAGSQISAMYSRSVYSDEGSYITIKARGQTATLVYISNSVGWQAYFGFSDVDAISAVGLYLSSEETGGTSYLNDRILFAKSDGIFANFDLKLPEYLTCASLELEMNLNFTGAGGDDYLKISKFASGAVDSNTPSITTLYLDSVVSGSGDSAGVTSFTDGTDAGYLVRSSDITASISSKITAWASLINASSDITLDASFKTVDNRFFLTLDPTLVTQNVAIGALGLGGDFWNYTDVRQYLIQDGVTPVRLNDEGSGVHFFEWATASFKEANYTRKKPNDLVVNSGEDSTFSTSVGEFSQTPDKDAEWVPTSNSGNFLTNKYTFSLDVSSVTGSLGETSFTLNDAIPIFSTRAVFIIQTESGANAAWINSSGVKDGVAPVQGAPAFFLQPHPGFASPATIIGVGQTSSSTTQLATDIAAIINVASATSNSGIEASLSATASGSVVTFVYAREIAHSVAGDNSGGEWANAVLSTTVHSTSGSKPTFNQSFNTGFIAVYAGNAYVLVGSAYITDKDSVTPDLDTTNWKQIT